MTFSINIGVPLGTHDPADDVTPMRTNYANISSFLAVDHVAPGATDNGRHKQVGFPAKVAQAVPVSDEAGVVFTAAGVADTPRPQLMFLNKNASLPISTIRAYALINGISGLVIAGQSFNCTSSKISTGLYSIALTAGAVAPGSLFYGVLVTPGTINNSDGTVMTAGYGNTTDAGFRVSFAKPSSAFDRRDPDNFTVQVIQI